MSVTDPAGGNAGGLPTRHPRLAHVEFGVLFFLQSAALGMWQVPLGNVLRAHGLEHYIAYAYASSALAAILSPMFVGALADQRISPTKLLRWLSAAGAVWMVLAFAAIDRGWGPWWMLALFQLHSLCAAPTVSLLVTIIFARLSKPGREFGPLRAWATFGWIVAGWVVSWVLHADDSTRSGYGSAVLYASVAVVSLLLPSTPPIVAGAANIPGARRDIWGLQALQLLRDRDHLAVFITAALYNVPLAAFYPFTPIHLHAVGVVHATAVMSLGQTTEILSMFALAWLLARVRLKWLFLTGIAFGVTRYALFSLDTRAWLIMGIFLHGIAFSLYFITAQIYVEHRVDPALRGRAQALLTLMVSGVGNLFGFLGTGWWWAVCERDGATRWPIFWAGLSGVIVLVFAFFATFYRGLPHPVAHDKLN